MLFSTAPHIASIEPKEMEKRIVAGSPFLEIYKRVIATPRIRSKATNLTTFACSVSIEESLLKRAHIAYKAVAKRQRIKKSEGMGNL